MKLLALDTATEACSVALHLNGETICRYKFAPRKHADLILSMVDDLLSEAEIKLKNLDVLCFGRGPGAFTGVRIATGVIQGLAFAADLPVVPISTLATLAQGATDKSEYLFSAIDARMGEIYWCLFQVKDNLVTAITDESVTKPEQLTVPVNKQWFGIGSGWATYTEVLQKIVDKKLIGHDGETYPHAKDMVPLAINAYESGKVVSAEAAVPVYLRNKVTG